MAQIANYIVNLKYWIMEGSAYIYTRNNLSLTNTDYG